jgi:hypothetical protein
MFPLEFCLREDLNKTAQGNGGLDPVNGYYELS